MLLTWLQQWYQDKCDGNWEHDFGIKIATLDNPGWSVDIDLEDTSVEISDITYQLFEVNDSNWFGYQIKNSAYSGCGDPNKLELIIYVFREIVEGREVTADKILSKM